MTAWKISKFQPFRCSKLDPCFKPSIRKLCALAKIGYVCIELLRLTVFVFFVIELIVESRICLIFGLGSWQKASKTLEIFKVIRSAFIIPDSLGSCLVFANKIAHDEGWSPERSTVWLESWGFEVTKPQGEEGC